MLLDPEMGEVFALESCIQAEIYIKVYALRVYGARPSLIYQPPGLIPTLESIHYSPTVLLDPENVRVAFGISLLIMYTR